MSNDGYTYNKLECDCGRKILLERLVNGSDHDVWLKVTCARCLPKQASKDYKKDKPEAAKDIWKWKKVKGPVV